MSDSPYDRDHPDEPLEPEPTAPPGPAPATGASAEPADAEPSPAAAAPTQEDAPGDGAPTVVDASPTPDETTTVVETAPVPDGPATVVEPPPTAHDATTVVDETPATDRDSAVTSTFDVREAERRRPAGVHQVERPIPRSGLAEHDSAGYLTGARPPRDAEHPGHQAASSGATAPTWLDETSAAATATGGAAAAGAPDPERSRPDRDVLLDGTTALTRTPSRTGAHVWALVLTLLLTPVAWYLVADAGARLTLPAGNPWDTGNLNLAALLELGGGLLVLAVVLLAARWSSLGAIVTGSLVIVLGVPFLAVPTQTQEVLGRVTTWLEGLGDFGGNVAHHLAASGSTGRLVVVGVALILLGVVSHGARRKGRRDVRPVTEPA